MSHLQGCVKRILRTFQNLHKYNCDWKHVHEDVREYANSDRHR